MTSTYTSLSSYGQHVLNGKATSQRNRILDCLFESGVPLSRRQIKELTGLEINAVCGRVNALLKSDLIHVVCESIDPGTDRMVELLWPQLKQKELF